MCVKNSFLTLRREYHFNTQNGKKAKKTQKIWFLKIRMCNIILCTITDYMYQVSEFCQGWTMVFWGIQYLEPLRARWKAANKGHNIEKEQLDIVHVETEFLKTFGYRICNNKLQSKRTER